MKKLEYCVAVMACLLMLALSQAASALYQSPSPWPMWRYDQIHSGYTTSAVTNRNMTVWDTSANYYPSIPIVVDGKVIFAGTSNRVYALDEVSGVELWRSISLAGSLTYGNPSYSDGRVFVTSYNGYLYCINATTGKKEWENQLTSTGQIQSSPTVANGRVYVTTTDNYLFGCDVTTGSYDNWYYTAANKIYSSPAVSGNMVYFGCDDGKIYALDTSNPAGFVMIWRFQTAGQVRSSPCVAGDKLFIGSSGTDHSVFALNATATTPIGQLIWKYTLDVGYAVDGTPAYHNGVVYFTFYSGKVYALNANASPGNYTENQPGCKMWSQTIGSYNVGSCSPAVADDKVVATDDSNSVYCLNITSGAVIWSSRFASAPYDPVVADGNVFVNDYYNVHCIGDYYPPVTYYYTVTPPGAGGQSYSIKLVIANATPSQTINTQLLVSQFKINYTVTGIDGTVGMSNITIDDNMLVGPYTVRINGGLIPSPVVVDNGTYTSIYFTYSQSTNEVLITGTNAIVPELSPLAILASIMVASAIIAMLAKSSRFRKNRL
jgi:outer membrane protein assembly factor BamB